MEQDKSVELRQTYAGLKWDILFNAETPPQYFSIKGQGGADVTPIDCQRREADCRIANGRIYIGTDAMRFGHYRKSGEFALICDLTASPFSAIFWEEETGRYSSCPAWLHVGIGVRLSVGGCSVFYYALGQPGLKFSTPEPGVTVSGTSSSTNVSDHAAAMDPALQAAAAELARSQKRQPLPWNSGLKDREIGVSVHDFSIKRQDRVRLNVITKPIPIRGAVEVGVFVEDILICDPFTTYIDRACVTLRSGCVREVKFRGLGGEESLEIRRGLKRAINNRWDTTDLE